MIRLSTSTRTLEALGYVQGQRHERHVWPCHFNQDVGSWGTPRVSDMSYRFTGASFFNQDVCSWDTSKVTDMLGSTFDRLLNRDFSFTCPSWKVRKLLCLIEYGGEDLAASNSFVGPATYA